MSSKQDKTQDLEQDLDEAKFREFSRKIMQCVIDEEVARKEQDGIVKKNIKDEIAERQAAWDAIPVINPDPRAYPGLWQ